MSNEVGLKILRQGDYPWADPSSTHKLGHGLADQFALYDPVPANHSLTCRIYYYNTGSTLILSLSY